jgi:predicted nucleic acid-binding protein
MVKLKNALVGVTKLGFDTSPIIYFVEANPRYDALVAEVFRRISKATFVGITSAVTVTEVLVHPLKQKKTTLKQKYSNLLLHSANFNVVPVDAVVAERAAELRARYNLRTPDALQVAAALVAGCEAFLTNDKGLKRVTELRVLVLDDLSL